MMSRKDYGQRNCITRMHDIIPLPRHSRRAILQAVDPRYLVLEESPSISKDRLSLHVHQDQAPSSYPTSYTNVCLHQFNGSSFDGRPLSLQRCVNIGLSNVNHEEVQVFLNVSS